MAEDRVLFQNMGLDPRILKSVFAQGWSEPTLIQEKAIMLAMEGKDILMKGRTGCGKSAAFLIPILNKLLELKSSDPLQVVRAIVMAPSKELCKQLYNHAQLLNSCSSKYITIVDVSESKHVKPLVLEKPDMVIGTPSSVLKLLKDHHLSGTRETLKFLVVDEADLMFSFGYKDDMKEILEQLLPEEGCQSILVSATLNPDIKGLKSMLLQNPVIIKLEEPDLPESDKLTQYHIQCEEEDKFVLVIALFKLKLIRGRTIIFVNSVDRCYKLKLFLEQFDVRSCVLNSELPITSRCSVVDQFNRGMYDIIIASDETCAQNPTETKKKKSRVSDNEYNVSRGIDFQNVSNVINFDFPTSTISYIHRVGRTARGHVDAEGTALSFISLKEQNYFDVVKEALNAGSNFKPYQFRMEELEAFRYRARDAVRAVTSIAIKEARIKEIKREMLTSDKLKSYFKEHPKDLKVLRHDKALHTVKHQQHLKHIPEYIVPPTLQGLVQTDNFVNTSSQIIDTEAELYSRPTKKVRHGKKRKQDPWKSFSVRRRK